MSASKIFADASNTALSFVPEDDPGVTPSSPVFQRIGFTDESISDTTETTKSNEITPMNQVTDLIEVGGNTSGDIGVELSAEPCYASLLAAVMRSEWGADDTITVGTITPSFTIEKIISAGSKKFYQRYLGCHIGSMSLDIKSKSIATAKFSILGQGMQIGETVAVGATYVDNGDSPKLAARDITEVLIDGSGGIAYFTDLSFTATNNLRERPALGHVRAVGVGYGQFDLNGTFTAYFSDHKLLEKYISRASFQLKYSILDNAGNGFELLFPKVKMSESPKTNAGGNSQDIMVTSAFQALYDPVTKTTLKITRITA